MGAYSTFIIVFLQKETAMLKFFSLLIKIIKKLNYPELVYVDPDGSVYDLAY